MRLLQIGIFQIILFGKRIYRKCSTMVSARNIPSAQYTPNQSAHPHPLAIRNIVVEVSYIVQTYSYYYDNLNTLHIYRSVLIDIL